MLLVGTIVIAQVLSNGYISMKEEIITETSSVLNCVNVDTSATEGEIKDALLNSAVNFGDVKNITIESVNVDGNKLNVCSIVTLESTVTLNNIEDNANKEDLLNSIYDGDSWN